LIHYTVTRGGFTYYLAYRAVWSQVRIYGNLQSCCSTSNLPGDEAAECAHELRKNTYAAIDEWHAPSVALGALALLMKGSTSLPGLDEEGNLQRLADLFRISREFLDDRMQLAEEEIAKGGEEWKWTRATLEDHRRDLEVVQCVFLLFLSSFFASSPPLVLSSLALPLLPRPCFHTFKQY
jgi:hypothetical protein